MLDGESPRLSCEHQSHSDPRPTMLSSAAQAKQGSNRTQRSRSLGQPASNVPSPCPAPPAAAAPAPQTFHRLSWTARSCVARCSPVPPPRSQGPGTDAPPAGARSSIAAGGMGRRGNGCVEQGLRRCLHAARVREPVCEPRCPALRQLAHAPSARGRPRPPPPRISYFCLPDSMRLCLSAPACPFLPACPSPHLQVSDGLLHLREGGRQRSELIQPLGALQQRRGAHVLLIVLLAISQGRLRGLQRRAGR
jgi:hypothetical protein